MKRASVHLAFFLVLRAAAVAPPASVVSMVSIKEVSHITPPEGTETVVHAKEKNGGYKKGSPLYNKQEGIPEKDKPDKNPTQAHSAVDQAIKGQQATIEGPKDASEAQQHVSEAAGLVYGHLFVSLGSVSVYAVAVLIFAYLNWKRKFGVEPLGARTEGRTVSKLPLWTNCGFAHSFFDCSNLHTDWPICLTAWCCPIISWADTASRSMKPYMSYWKAVALFLGLVVLGPFTLGLSGLVMGVFLFLRRGDLRKTYRHSKDQANVKLSDFCVVFCCSQFLCCQLVQEAREIEYTSAKA